MLSEKENTTIPIRFQSFEEITSRLKWRDGVNATQHKPICIIGDYSFSKENQVHCGLKGCRSPHMYGYVIETEDGIETHIGNRCGKNHFGVSWGEIHSVYQKAAEDRDRQEWLTSVISERDALQEKTQSLLRSVVESNQQIKLVIDRLKKEPELYSSFMRVVRAGGVIQVEKTIDAETARAMRLPQNQRHILENIGRITNIDVLPSGSITTFPGDLIASNLRTRSIPTFNQLTASSLRNLNPRQRKDRVKDIEEAKSVLREAENHVAKGQAFMKPANLRQIGKLPVFKMNQRAERILKQFSSTPD